jgi:dTDP-4-amino-4,6-dideoxy-D-galactose acyltransferase
LLKIDKWLSSQLGYSAYNIDNTSLKNFNFLRYKSKNILISIKTNKKFKNSFLKKNQIKLIEKNITFLKSARKKKVEINYFKNIRLANIFDKKAILDIAGSSFIKSRFYKDKNITKRLARKIKRNWVLNFFRKKRGEHLIVSEVNKKVVGFLLILKNQKDYIIDLIAVKKIYQNLGIGTKMIEFLENNILKQNKVKIYVSTQFDNKDSIKLYIKNKFKVKYRKYVYHFNGY